MVIVRRVAERHVILAACPRSYELGIRINMTLTQARAIYASIQSAEHNPHDDARRLLALARWLLRFTPLVMMIPSTTPAQTEAEAHPNETRQPALHAVILDVSGCERLFGGIDNILLKLHRSLAGFGLHHRIGIGPTIGSAWAFAMARPVQIDQVNRRHPDLPEQLRPLPIHTLRLQDKIVVDLKHLGIDTIGRLMNLPRNALPSRFGPTVLLRLDQALGTAPEVLEPVRPIEPIQASVDFDYPVQALEAIWLILQRLLEQIVLQLLRRGQGARTLVITLFRQIDEPVIKTLSLSCPSRDLKMMWNLVRCALDDSLNEQQRLSHNKKSRLGSMLSDGYTGFRLDITLSERISDDQIDLFDLPGSDSARELRHFIERLRAKLGADAIMQSELLESYVPEHAFCYVPPGKFTMGTRGAIQKQTHRRSNGGVIDPPVADAQLESLRVVHDSMENPPLRPLTLFHPPREIAVIVSPSHDRDGRPIAFTHDRRHHRVIHSTGPERIAGQWWTGHNKTRDYFDVEIETGQRFWIFRVQENGRWFLHGT